MDVKDSFLALLKFRVEESLRYRYLVYDNDHLIASVHADMAEHAITSACTKVLGHNRKNCSVIRANIGWASPDDQTEGEVANLEVEGSLGMDTLVILPRKKK